MTADSGTLEEVGGAAVCDLEPIQFLGCIQPFAALVEVSADWLITRASANIGEFLGIGVEETLGRPAADVLGASVTHEIRGLLQAYGTDPGVKHLFGLATAKGISFDVAVHRLPETIVMEFERHEVASEKIAAAVQPLIMQLRHLESLDRLCAQVVRQIRALTGFERVMIYQFHADGSGEVVAETKRSELSAFMGLRYPASDIPQQARILYQRNMLRLIADVSAAPVPVIPQMDPSGQPLDLSQAVSRAVSPTHIEYLRNMQVGASMSISIVAGGRLWGLIACHHRLPKLLPQQSRTALEFFGQMFSTIMESQLRSADLFRQESSRSLHTTMLSALASPTATLDDLVPQLRMVQSLLAADGVASFVDGRLRLFGATPDESQCLDLMQFLNRVAASRVYGTHALSSVFPEAAAYTAVASGVLAVPVSRKPRDFVVFFRGELVKQVTWAGEPAKSVTRSDDGVRLSPRKSFESWRQTVLQQSATWSEGDYAIAESLRVTLIEFMLQVTDRAEKQRKVSNDQQDLLIAELNHRVRNILNLIVGLVRQCSESATSVSVLAEEITGRIRALARAHDQLTSNGWGSRSLVAMIQVETGAYLGAKADRVVVIGDDVQVMPDAFATLALVLHELITNAAKYGALADARGRVELRLEHDRLSGLSIFWREFGGAPVREPTRRGFGSTIIERAIPHELGGEAEIRFATDGVQARFLIPPRYLSHEPPPAVARVEAAAQETARHERLEGVVLLVEDNLLIALETEDALKALGAADVFIASSVSAALGYLGEVRPDYAVLDYNLGSEHSVQVAERLAADGVPFAFATGYGDSALIDPRFRTRPIISKPYTSRSLLQAFNAAVEGSPAG